MKRLAIFDFDGTITKKDSFLEFIKFYRGTFGFYKGFGLLSPVMTLFLLKLIPNWKAKQAALKLFFGGEDIEFFNRKCNLFAEHIIPTLLRPTAIKAIEQHKAQGDRIVVISASAENWLKLWCEKYNLELLATKLVVEQNKITGDISGFNCYGEEKSCRLNDYLDLKEYKEIHVYGDSAGDKAILALATHPYYRHFH